MTYEEILAEYKLDDLCPEVDNELNGTFIDMLGEEFEIGIFPEQDPDDEGKFLVTVEISCDGAELSTSHQNDIRALVEEHLFKMLSGDADVVRPLFSGVQIYLNDDLLG